MFARLVHRCLPSTRVRSFCSAPPALVNGFLRQNRPNTRELVDVVQLRAGGTIVRIEVADSLDAALCAQIATDTFVSDCAIFTHLGVTQAEALPYFRHLVTPALANGMSLLAFDGDKLIGHAVAKLQTRPEYSETFGYDLHHGEPRLKFKPDYDAEVSEGPWESRKMNLIHTCYQQAVRQAGKFIPFDVELLQTGEVIGIHSDYVGSGLARRMLEVNLQMCKDRRVDFDICFCVASGSARTLTKLGRRLLYEFPYSKFKVNGQIVFENPCDGATGIQVLGTRLH